MILTLSPVMLPGICWLIALVSAAIVAIMAYLALKLKCITFEEVEDYDGNSESA